MFLQERKYVFIWYNKFVLVNKFKYLYNSLFNKLSIKKQIKSQNKQ